MRCQICGFMNGPGSKVCSKCGTNLKAPGSPNSTSDSPFHKTPSSYDSMPTERSIRPQQPDLVKKPAPIEDNEIKTTLFQNIHFEKGATKKPSKIALIDLATNKPLVFEGEDIILNRANLNPNDKSISSSQHVQLTKENDQWQLKDLSSNQATFVQATDKVTLENGVHIIVGTRIYKIEIQ